MCSQSRSYWLILKEVVMMLSFLFTQHAPQKYSSISLSNLLVWTFLGLWSSWIWRYRSNCKDRLCFCLKLYACPSFQCRRIHCFGRVMYVSTNHELMSDFFLIWYERGNNSAICCLKAEREAQLRFMHWCTYTSQVPICAVHSPRQTVQPVYRMKTGSKHDDYTSSCIWAFTKEDTCKTDAGWSIMEIGPFLILY